VRLRRGESDKKMTRRRERTNTSKQASKKKGMELEIVRNCATARILQINKTRLLR